MEIETEIRVRYNECDPMGVVHHAIYPIWFEMGRTELLRSQGGCYKNLEEDNMFLAVSELHIKYKASAKYDDELTLITKLNEATRVRLTHSYTLVRGNQAIATASTVLVCVNERGTIREIPQSLLGSG
jgi:acyl-CoA thioester hydrolase